MSALIIVWSGSLVVMGGILFFAQLRRPRSAIERSPQNMSELIRTELFAVLKFLRAILYTVRPHARRAAISFVILLRRSHDIFIERLFGHIEIEKGKAASFFLKRIAEHKEITRSNIDRREAA